MSRARRRACDLDPIPAQGSRTAATRRRPAACRPRRGGPAGIGPGAVHAAASASRWASRATRLALSRIPPERFAVEPGRLGQSAARRLAQPLDRAQQRELRNLEPDRLERRIVEFRQLPGGAASLRAVAGNRQHDGHVPDQRNRVDCPSRDLPPVRGAAGSARPNGGRPPAPGRGDRAVPFHPTCRTSVRNCTPRR